MHDDAADICRVERGITIQHDREVKKVPREPEFDWESVVAATTPLRRKPTSPFQLARRGDRI